ncbi:MAG: DEAD/DEAH box helicase [Actinomycetia bacterium]|nr:DEAD/DEAH box helicase [Actinomycetes bacterium]
MLALRDYQRAAVAAVQAAARAGVRRQLVVLPTGSGKTVVAAALSQQAPGRTLFLCHRDELVQQAAAKFRVVWPEADVGVVQAARDEGDRRVVVASVPTLHHPRRRARLDPDRISLVIVDEAHHVTAATWRAILADLGCWPDPPPGRILLGLTATPYRGDGVGLGHVFERIVYRRSLADLIRAGYLADVRGLRVDTALDLSRVRIEHGDFRVPDLSRAVDTPARNALIVAAYRAHGAGRKAVAFTVDVAHAQHLAAAFQDAGVAADWVAGSLPLSERRARLARFRAGALQVLTNAQLLTEGWDEPSVGCLIMARPTRSKTLFVQMVGRGLRPYPGKTDCLVLDVADSAHQLVTLDTLRADGVLSAPAAPSQPASRATRARKPAEAPPAVVMDGTPAATPVDLLARSRFRWHVGRGRMELEAGPGQVIVLIDQGEDQWTVTLVGRGVREALHDRPLPLAYAQGVAEDWVRAHDQAGYAARDAAWRQRPATAKQVAFLQALGVPVPADLTREEAADLIRDARRRRALEDPNAPWRQEPASPRQVAWMRAHGLPVPDHLTKGEFSDLLARRRRSRRTR